MLVLDKWTANNDGRQAIFRRAKGQRKFRAELCWVFSYVVSSLNGR